MTPPTVPTTSTPATTAASGSRQVPSYGGNALRGRIFMTDGHQLATATRHPDNTVTVDHLPQAPLWRLRFAVAHRPPTARVPVGGGWVPARPRPHPPARGRQMAVTPGSDAVAAWWPGSGPRGGQPSSRERAGW